MLCSLNVSFLWVHKIIACVNESSPLAFLTYFANEGVKNKLENSISAFAVNQILVNGLVHLIWLGIFKTDLLHSARAVSSNLANAIGSSRYDYYFSAYRYVMSSLSLYNCDLSSISKKSNPQSNRFCHFLLTIVLCIIWRIAWLQRGTYTNSPYSKSWSNSWKDTRKSFMVCCRSGQCLRI